MRNGELRVVVWGLRLGRVLDRGRPVMWWSAMVGARLACKGLWWEYRGVVVLVVFMWLMELGVSAADVVTLGLGR